MATTRNQLSYGSQGSSVTELQKLLNNHGYSLEEDGIFGDNTKSAVEDFQQKKGLDVDGIVGVNTWGSLDGTYTPKTSTGTTEGTTATTNTNTGTTDNSFKYDAYQESDAVKQAQALLNQQLANKPGQYTSPWQAQLNDAINKIMNREKFSYDMNADALYQQYKDQYVTQGQMAMMDTMGQAAAMTGGYGNSYAQSVGQQAYQGSLQQLNDKIPELYQLALNKYQMEGEDLYNQYSLLSTQDQQDYGKYRDTVSDWNTEMNRLQNQYNTERDYDYGKWADNRDFDYGQHIDDRNYEYQVGRDQVADEQWQAEFDEAVRQFNLQFNKKSVSSGGGSGSGGSSSKYTGNPNPNPNPEEEDEEPETTTANVHTVAGQKQLSSQINSEINSAYKSGQITASQAQKLKQELNPKGYTK